MTVPRLLAEFSGAEEFLTRYAQEMKAGGLLVRGAVLPAGTSVGPCVLELRVAGQPPLALDAQIAASIPGVGVAVMFAGGAAALQGLLSRLQTPAPAPTPETVSADAGEAPPADAPDGEEGAEEEVPAEEEAPAAPTLMSAKLAALNVSQKMQLALSGDREARAYLLRDTNKVLHVYVLRNPRIGLDEVQSAAKMASLSPEALKLIAEHREWGSNPAVCTALARNPRAPVPLVLKLLPRVPMAELRALAKGTGRPAIVQAARKLVLGA
jgi:hypothetical protein